MEIEKLTFEEAFAALEETVQKLEDGELALEAALELFEQGMALARRCDALLDQAELRVRQLVPAEDGDSYELRPFEA